MLFHHDRKRSYPEREHFRKTVTSSNTKLIFPGSRVLCDFKCQFHRRTGIRCLLLSTVDVQLYIRRFHVRATNAGLIEKNLFRFVQVYTFNSHIDGCAALTTLRIDKLSDVSALAQRGLAQRQRCHHQRSHTPRFERCQNDRFSIAHYWPAPIFASSTVVQSRPVAVLKVCSGFAVLRL